MDRLSIDEMIDDIIQREGGFVDHPADRGGPTKYGITQKTLDAWHKRLEAPGEPLNIRDLQLSGAKNIYRHMYYLDPGIDRLPEPWQPLVFDWAVHSGPVTAIKELQKLLHGHLFTDEDIAVDGVIGPQTTAAARRVLNSPLMAYLDERRAFCEVICETRPDQHVFLKGWLNRIAELEKALL